MTDSDRVASCPLRGEVVYLYAFDVANEIRLDRAAELLAAELAVVPAVSHTGSHRTVTVPAPPPSGTR